MKPPIVFDLDGTLIDSLPNVTQAMNSLLAEEGLPPVTEDLVVNFVGRGEKIGLQRLIDATDLDPHDFDRLMAAFIPHYEQAALQTRLYPGAREAVDRLLADGFKLALCTNKPRAPLIPTLEAATLDDVFEVVMAGDDLDLRKPDPAPVFEIMKRVGAETCVYVGDSEVDAETAQRAGAPFVFYTEGIRAVPVHDIPHDVAFNDFGMLPAICARLAGV